MGFSRQEYWSFLGGGVMANIFSVFCVLFYHLQVVWVRCIALLQLEKGNAYENIKKKTDCRKVLKPLETVGLKEKPKRPILT